MAKKGWIGQMTGAKGFKKGALTRQAEAAGEKPMAFARQHKNDGGLTGKRANAAINMQKRSGHSSYCEGGKVIASRDV